MMGESIEFSNHHHLFPCPLRGRARAYRLRLTAGLPPRRCGRRCDSVRRRRTSRPSWIVQQASCGRSCNEIIALSKPPARITPGAQAAGDTRCGPPVADEGQRVDYAVEFALAERRSARAAGCRPLPLRIRRRQTASERDEPGAFRARRLQHFPARFLA